MSQSTLVREPQHADVGAALRLPAHPASVAAARRHVRRELLAQGRDDLVDDAELAVSELVGNVVVHARTWCDVVVRVQPHGVLVLVGDDDPTMPVPRAAGDEAVSGRGLALVRAVSQACGADRRGGGKVVWCALAG